MNETVIATIDMQRLLSESNGGQRLIAEIEQTEREKQAEFATQVKSALALRAKYFASVGQLAHDKELCLRQEVEQNEMRIARLQETMIEELQKRRVAVLASFERLIFPLIEQVAEANGIALVLQHPQQNLVYCAPEINITDTLSRRLMNGRSQ